MPSSRQKTCVFCQRTGPKISKEDVLPKWILKLAPNGTKCGFVNANGTIRHEWQLSGKNGLSINDVCRQCNHGWMEQIESLVQPFLKPMIIEGEKTEITDLMARDMAAWILKTAMSFDLVRDNMENTYFSAQDRRNLIDTRVANERLMFIWLGRFKTDRFNFILNKEILVSTENAQPFVNDSKFYVFTLAVGQVAFQIITFLVCRPTPYVDVRGWDRSTLRIWPPQGIPLMWPPREVLDKPGLYRFLNRWHAVTKVSN